MKEMRQLKKELGYERSEKLSEMFKPVVPKDDAPKKPGAKEGHECVTRPMPEKTDEKKKLFLRTCPQGHRLAKIKETRSRTIEDIELIRRLKINLHLGQNKWMSLIKQASIDATLPGKQSFIKASS